jgi:hypothetical protein
MLSKLVFKNRWDEKIPSITKEQILFITQTLDELFPSLPSIDE